MHCKTSQRSSDWEWYIARRGQGNRDVPTCAAPSSAAAGREVNHALHVLNSTPDLRPASGSAFPSLRLTCRTGHGIVVVVREEDTHRNPRSPQATGKGASLVVDGETAMCRSARLCHPQPLVET
jgi:hypothetical protein